MARPCSAQRIALLEALADGPGTSRQLAARVGVSELKVVTRTLDNLVRCQLPDVVVLTTTRVPGCKRPVPVYGRLHSPGHGDPANDSGVSAAFAMLGQALFGASGLGAAA